MKEFKITSDLISLQIIEPQLESKEIGARSVFEGIVRNINDGNQVRKLEYECYESLAIKEGKRILDEATDKYDLIDAFCIHRVGVLEIGETAVAIVVTSRHRDSSFMGCRYIIDEVKARVPIWKKEYYKDSESEWLKGAG